MWSGGRTSCDVAYRIWLRAKRSSSRGQFDIATVNGPVKWLQTAISTINTGRLIGVTAWFGSLAYEHMNIEYNEARQ